MKKQYPKVPRHDHESVDESLYNADDLVLLEKMDGSNFRLCMYDSRYSDTYGTEIHQFNPEDGDVFIGTKGTVRGRLSDDVSKFDGNFGRVISALRTELDASVLKSLHNVYDSPLLLFGEHMIRHTLDYGYNTSPPPAFIGFDVFVMTEYTEPPSNPFEQRFDGFLPIDEAFDIFNMVGLETIPVIDSVESGINPGDITVPVSEYGALQAEGVVIRSDSRNRRTKLVTDQFQERMHESWGMNESEAESGEELFVSRYLTNARLRKTIQKLAYRTDDQNIDAKTIAQVAIADAWEEELYDIRTIELPFTPQDVFPLARDRAEAVLETMKTNAQINGTTLERLWEDFRDEDLSEPVSTITSNTGRQNSVSKQLENAEHPNQELVECLLSKDDIHSNIDAIVAESDTDIGRWVITEVYETYKDKFWYENVEVIAHLSAPITPATVTNAVMEYITAEVNSRDDVDIYEKPDDWKTDIETAETDGLGDLFGSD